MPGRRGERAGALIGVLGVGLAATLLLLPSPAGEQVEPSVGTQLGACVPFDRLRSVGDLNALIRETPSLASMLGADVGLDHLLAPGRRLWIFGDTLLAGADGLRLVRNSMILRDRRCLHPVVPAGGGAIVPDREDGVGYWPMSVFEVPPPAGGEPGQYVDVMLQRVVSDSAGLFGFRILGPALAELRVVPGEAPELLRVTDLGTDDDDPNRPLWGAAVARDGRWLYLYGTSSRDVSGIHGFALRVARVRPEQVAAAASWTYWDGGRWVHDATRARDLIGERGGVSRVLSVFRSNGQWFVLSKVDEVLGRSIAVWRAAGPQGPFRPPEVVAELPCGPNGQLRYMPLAHPRLLPRKGTMVVSYSQNAEFEDVCAEPSIYRPRFLRIDLPEGPD